MQHKEGERIMSRKFKFLLFIGLILSLALTACGSTAPTQAPAAQAPAVTEEPAVTEAPAAIALKVTGDVTSEQAWTEDQVKGMKTVEVEATNKNGEKAAYTGVLISDLLALAQPNAHANTVVFVADDGYTAEIPLQDVTSCANCIVSFRDKGGFSTVLPDQPGKLQVKGVNEIQLSNVVAAAPEPPANPNLILATTTSTQDSGLLDVLVPLFQEQTGYTVQTVAVGSGQAMEMGQQGMPMSCWFTRLRLRNSSWRMAGARSASLSCTTTLSSSVPRRIRPGSKAFLPRMHLKPSLLLEHPLPPAPTNPAPAQRSLAFGKRRKSTRRPRNPPGTWRPVRVWAPR
jgi:hypothetical protein